MTKFTGSIDQVPPMYSAKKIGGKKLYELARAGQEVERKPAKVTVHELILVEYDPPRLVFRARCSSGTYVRTLAHDIGQKLGVGAYLKALRRTAIGDLHVDDALRLEALSPENWPSFLRAL